MGLILGGTIGTIAALNQNSRLDYGVMFFGMVGISIPNFVMAPLLVLIFSIALNTLPAGGYANGAPLHDPAGRSSQFPGRLYCKTHPRIYD